MLIYVTALLLFNIQCNEDILREQMNYKKRFSVTSYPNMLQESKKSGGADRISKRRGLNAQTVCEAHSRLVLTSDLVYKKKKQKNRLLSEYGSLKGEAVIYFSVVYGPIEMTRCK